jgi:flavin-dependent trigonelline monooxygenase, reductase component
VADASKPFDPLELRDALGWFATGVTVITTRSPEGDLVGFTANSFTSVSLDPPLVLVCIARTAGSYPLFSMTAHFGVNILSEEQRPISSRFASKEADKFAQVEWRPGHTGSPLIAGTVAWLDCRAEQQIDAGDHLILVGRVLDFQHSTQTPLGFCRGNYLRFGLEQQAITATPTNAIRVGAILEKDERVLLLKDAATDGWALPLGSSLGRTPTETGSLKRLLDSLGIEAQIGFLFAVFDDEKTGALSVFYRGEIAGIADGHSGPARLVALSEIPWKKLPDFATQSMLRRYVNERSEDRFGIYVGTSEAGTVRGLDRAT